MTSTTMNENNSLAKNLTSLGPKLTSDNSPAKCNITSSSSLGEFWSNFGSTSQTTKERLQNHRLRRRSPNGSSSRSIADQQQHREQYHRHRNNDTAGTFSNKYNAAPGDMMPILPSDQLAGTGAPSPTSVIEYGYIYPGTDTAADGHNENSSTSNNDLSAMTMNLLSHDDDDGLDMNILSSSNATYHEQQRLGDAPSSPPKTSGSTAGGNDCDNSSLYSYFTPAPSPSSTYASSKKSNTSPPIMMQQQQQQQQYWSSYSDSPKKNDRTTKVNATSSVPKTPTNKIKSSYNDRTLEMSTLHSTPKTSPIVALRARLRREMQQREKQKEKQTNATKADTNTNSSPVDVSGMTYTAAGSPRTPSLSSIKAGDEASLHSLMLTDSFTNATSFITPTKKKRGRNSSRTSSYKSGSNKENVRPNSNNNNGNVNGNLRHKTEMCAYYTSSSPCPFGSRCHFAHGREELHRPKIMDLVRAGIIKDVDAGYRVRPCPTFVSTGACPYGNRCNNIHDPSAGGQVPAWLPVCQTPVRKLDTNVNVDHLYHHTASDLAYGSPFGRLTRASTESGGLDCNSYLEWREFYNLIASGAPSSGLLGPPPHNSITPPRSFNVLTEKMILEIVLKMRLRGGTETSHARFKYQPDHIIRDALCQVLNTKVFHVDDANDTVYEFGSSPVHCGHKIVIVNEIAFGPEADPAVRGVALYFGLPENELVYCEPREIDMHLKMKARAASKNNKGNSRGSPSVRAARAEDAGPDLEMMLPSCHRPFYLIHPHDDDAFQLVGDILAHRLDVLKTSALAGTTAGTFDAMDAFSVLRAQSLGLQGRYESQCMHWEGNAWPVSKDRLIGEDIDEDALSPFVESVYSFPPDCIEIPSNSANTGSSFGRHHPSSLNKVWNAFISNIRSDAEEHNVPQEDRLNIFRQLCDDSISTLSHRGDIPTLSRSNPFRDDADTFENHPTNTGNDMWMELLLSQGASEQTEWGKVQAHYPEAVAAAAAASP